MTTSSGSHENLQIPVSRRLTQPSSPPRHAHTVSDPARCKIFGPTSILERLGLQTERSAKFRSGSILHGTSPAEVEFEPYRAAIARYGVPIGVSRRIELRSAG